jgi:hypothetical protein
VIINDFLMSLFFLLFLVINLINRTIYNDVQIRCFPITRGAMEAHLGSLSLLGPSGLSEVGEEVKLVSFGYNTKWSLIGGRE